MLATLEKFGTSTAASGRHGGAAKSASSAAYPNPTPSPVLSVTPESSSVGGGGGEGADVSTDGRDGALDASRGEGSDV